MLLVAFLLLQGCQKLKAEKYEGEALAVTHSPNPSNIHMSEHFPNPIYPYTWYYKTEVKNNSDRDLKIVWFEGYLEHNGHWYGSNVLNRVLGNDVFLRWYGDDRTNDAWLKPGESRSCDPNWHGSGDPKGCKVKWAYIAVDRHGNDYFAESTIESVPIESGANDSPQGAGATEP